MSQFVRITIPADVAKNAGLLRELLVDVNKRKTALFREGEKEKAIVLAEQHDVLKSVMRAIEKGTR